ncbi:MAG: DUF2892 domain-containing protein [Bdellovibrionales bacterium]|nr:DUF2892 domain-containing protein [Bdellovibrionales bacterium]
METHTTPAKGDFNINVGCVDSFFRIFIGVVFMSLALMGTIGMWGLASGVFVVTGLARYCPFYAVCGLNSIRNNHDS